MALYLINCTGPFGGINADGSNLEVTRLDETGPTGVLITALAAG